MPEQLQKADQLAREVLKLSRNTLLVHLRFLDMALSCLEPVAAQGSLATDGRHIYYDARYVLNCYKNEQARPVRDYLHMVMHCLLRHMFLSKLVDTARWDLACDIAVENAINELQLRSTAAEREQLQKSTLARIRSEVKKVTAEHVYRWLIDKELSDGEVARMRLLFAGDDHNVWYNGGGSGNGDGDNNGGEDGDNADSASAQSLAELWKSVSERMQTDLETFSKKQGNAAGSLIQNLCDVNRETYDYTAFLKKFAVLGEAMKINDDEFDYIFYTYGLQLYDDLPLIEPLEYKEVKRIREFVIAIDTSGSVAGDLVQTFIQKTYNILQSTESFFSRINLHIIQCDAEIQEAVKITSKQEFDDYLKTMRLSGLGGTDFRPVFRYVDEMIRNKELRNFKGLIYFTDGFGTFPARKPDYDAAFVFVDDNNNDRDVPPWAIKLMLNSDEIKETPT